jgi:mannose-1-phosphate guanylyltransferase
LIKKAMIMAAGVGSRLDPLTKSTPKPLIPIVNQPVMDLLLKHLGKCGITEVVANTHCMAENIKQRYENSNSTGVKCTCVYEKDLSGTAGGVKKCESFFKNDDSFIVMSGDGLTRANLAKIIQSHIKSDAIATMGLTKVPFEEVKHFGVVVADKNGFVAEFQEKPPVKEAKSNLVNTGIYIFKKEIFDYIPPNIFYDFAKNVFPSLMADNQKINTFVINEYWSDIGTLDQYRNSTVDMLKGKVTIDESYEKRKFGFASKSSQIGKIISQNTVTAVGEGSLIEDNVTFEGYNVIGNNCNIKSGVHFNNCILWDDVNIEENVYLENCIIANNVVIKNNMHVAKNSVIAANSIISPETQADFLPV